MQITIHLKQGKYLDDETISKLILDSGYNVREQNVENSLYKQLLAPFSVCLLVLVL